MVTFQSKAWTSITMFSDVAVQLLKMMGHSGTVPSALLARDIPPALERLEKGLASAEPAAPAKPDEDDRDKEPHVELRTRAYPLMQMLKAAAAEGADILWDERR